MATKGLKYYKFVCINSKNERFKGSIYGTSLLDVVGKLKLDSDILSIISVEVDKKNSKKMEDDQIDKTKISMEKISVKDTLTQLKEKYNKTLNSIKKARSNAFKNKILIISKEDIPKEFINRQHVTTGREMFNDELFSDPESSSYSILDNNMQTDRSEAPREVVRRTQENIVQRIGRAAKSKVNLQSSISERLIKNVEVKKKKVQIDITDISYIEMKKIKRVKIKDLVDFSKKMEILLTSDILLVDSLIIVRESIRDKYFRKIIGNIVYNINSGQSLSDCMLAYPEIFDSFYVSTVLIGESVGALKHSFKDLYITYKNKLAINKKIKTASIYPSVVLVVLGLMMLAGSKFLIPTLKGLFATSGVKLPELTQIVFAASDNLGNILLALLIFSAIMVVVYKFIPSLNKLITFVLNIVALKLPVIGKFKNYTELYNFSTTMHIMLKNGMGLVESLDLSKKVVNNFLYRKQIDLVKNEILTGKSFAEVLAQYDFFDLFTSSMVKVGEESGDLEASFYNIVIYHQENIKELTDLIMELVQPIMTVLMGAIAGPLLVAIYMPLMSMMSGSGMK